MGSRGADCAVDRLDRAPRRSLRAPSAVRWLDRGLCCCGQWMAPRAGSVDSPGRAASQASGCFRRERRQGHVW